MATKKQAPTLFKGTASHRRTESDYMGALLDEITIEDWRDVVKGALQEAKAGDAQARNWLGQYLMGRPEAKAPTALTVVVNQLNGVDPVVDKLAKRTIDTHQFPSLHTHDNQNDYIKAQFARELNQKISNAQIVANPKPARGSE